MKKPFILFTLLIFSSATTFSQLWSIPADTVYSTAGKFGFGCPCEIENINIGINAAMDSTSNFSYEYASGFGSDSVGYISQLGNGTGTITFEYYTPFNAKGLLVWNAYFTIEADHSIKDVHLTFYDDQNFFLDSFNVTVPLADINVETGTYTPFVQTVNGVSKIEAQVNALHGGNEISLRRVAFTGSSETTGLSDNGGFIHLYPNPANSFLMYENVKQDENLSMRIYDQRGNLVLVESVYQSNRIDIEHLSSGLYFVKLDTKPDFGYTFIKR